MTVTAPKCSSTTSITATEASLKLTTADLDSDAEPREFARLRPEGLAPHIVGMSVIG